MFNDQRSKRVVFAVHCILNQNAISDGTADYPTALSGAFLPGAGPGRPAGSGAPGVGGEHPHPAGHPAAALRMEELVRQVVHQISEYRRNGFEVVGIVGMDRSSLLRRQHHLR